MDAEDEDSPTKPSSLQQHSSTVPDALPHLPTTLLHCHTAAAGRGGEGESQPPQPQPPTPEQAFSGDDKVVISGELSESVDVVGTSMENRDEAKVVRERDAFVGEVAGDTEAVVALAPYMGEPTKEEKVKVFEEAGLAVKNERMELEIAELAHERREMKVMEEADDKVAPDVSNVLETEEVEVVEESVAWRNDVAEKGNASGSVVEDPVEDEVMGGNDRDRIDEREVAEGTNDEVRVNVVGTGAEETEAANEVDLVEEEADAAGMAEETEGAEETELASEADLVEEEADAAGMAEETEGAEGTDMEVAEEQSRSISGGKRKRGRNSKATGRAPSRKKMEEDVCFICFDGGELVVCDRRGCPKAYHPSCVNRDEAFFRSKGKWNCGWHLCSNCEKNAYYMCYTCTFSLCKGCIKDAVILCVRGTKGFCETCMRTVMLIEQNEQENKDMGQVDFDNKNSWEYLFKDYYIDLKERLSLTYDEINEARNPWKGFDMLPAEQESPDELFYANNDKGSQSDSSPENVYLSTSKRRKAKKWPKSCSKERDSYNAVTVLGAEGQSADDSSEWASKELLEFVMHMRNGDKSVLSQFDVQALLLEYIKRNKLRDPCRKSQIICDARLQNLFGKPRVGHFEMLKLLESHFLLKEDFQTEDLQGSVVDTEVSHLEGDGNSNSHLKVGKDKRRKRKKGDERGLQSNVNDYAAIDNHNINLIYLRRNLVEELLEDTEKFHDKVVGSFVRIRISGSSQKQDLYRLVQVVGSCKAAEPNKVGKMMTDILLEILNLNKTEIVSIDIISNQEFTEDECKRLRQSIKCGLINRLTVGDIQDKALALQAVRVNDWLETEIVRLSHLRDRASEKGRRKELRECVEKLQLLRTPEERQRRSEEIPEIHADPNMDPSYESEEDEDEMDDKRQENYMRPRGSAFGRREREMISPRSGSISNDSWSGVRNYPSVNRELSRNLSNKGFAIKGDDVSNASEVLNDAQLLQGRERESQLSNSWERQKLFSSFESGYKNTQPVVTSESLSTVVLEASAAPSSIAPPVVKINETEKMWHYQDPSGKVQGPFSMVQLRKWSNTGYFPSDLRIWRTTENQDESILLTDALAGKFSKEPSTVDKSFPNAQMMHDLHYSTSDSGKSHLAVQGIDAQVGGRPTFDQNAGSWNSHSILGSSGQTRRGSWRSKDVMNSLASTHSPVAVEVRKNAANGWGSDAATRNESTNLPSPTSPTTSGGSRGQAFENKWSPTPVQSAGSHLGNPMPGGLAGLQAPVVVIPENVVKNADNGSSSQPGTTSAPKSEKGLLLSSTDTSQVHPQATAVAPVLASGVEIKTAGAHVQNLVVSSHNSHAEAQGWGSGLVTKPELQAWEVAPSQGIEPKSPATMPTQPLSHGHLGDASSIQNSASFSTGNRTGNFPMPGFPGMTTSEPWRPPTSSNQSNITAPAPPNIPWGMVVPENQNAGWGVMPGNSNINWGGPLPANANINWMPALVPAPGNANPGWAAPSQGPSPVNPVGWVSPGQGPSQVNANAGWVVPGQGLAPGSANPGWAASAGNPSMWGSEQSHNGDGFPNRGDCGPHAGDPGDGRVKPWNRQSSFSNRGIGGGSSRGQRGVCKYHESGHCRKGASCDYLHN